MVCKANATARGVITLNCHIIGEQPARFSPGLIMMAFACSTLIGVGFGFGPARNTARLDPIEALARD